MFKKLLMTAAVMLGALAVAQADGPLFSSPRGGPQSLAGADYGGVFVSTCLFCGTNAAVNFSSVAIPNLTADARTAIKGVFYGVIFSSGLSSLTDFVDVFDATSTVSAVGSSGTGAMVRLYNVANSTSPNMGGGASGFSGPPKPLRFNKGLIIKPSNSNYNTITTLYYRE